jgi:hypothetical protein
LRELLLHHVSHELILWIHHGSAHVIVHQSHRLSGIGSADFVPRHIGSSHSCGAICTSTTGTHARNALFVFHVQANRCLEIPAAHFEVTEGSGGVGTACERHELRDELIIANRV